MDATGFFHRTNGTLTTTQGNGPSSPRVFTATHHLAIERTLAPFQSEVPSSRTAATSSETFGLLIRNDMTVMKPRKLLRTSSLNWFGACVLNMTLMPNSRPFSRNHTMLSLSSEASIESSSQASVKDLPSTCQFGQTRSMVSFKDLSIMGPRICVMPAGIGPPPGGYCHRQGQVDPALEHKIPSDLRTPCIEHRCGGQKRTHLVQRSRELVHQLRVRHGELAGATALAKKTGVGVPNLRRRPQGAGRLEEHRCLLHATSERHDVPDASLAKLAGQGCRVG